MNIKHGMSKETFLQHYWLKEDLKDFCKKNNLPSNCSKQELTQIISAYLNNEAIPVFKKKKKPSVNHASDRINSEDIISNNYTNDENHRAFFRNNIGEHFCFNVQFMKWMNDNKGRQTYSDAIVEWLRLFNEKKNGKKNEIGSQFKYNQYTRDFFEDNPDLKKEQCIVCWKHKKNQPGLHKYEKCDLDVL